MIILMHADAQPEHVDETIARTKELGLKPVPLFTENQVMIVVTGDVDRVDPETIESWDWVHKVTRITSPFKFASRSTKPEDTVIELSGVKIGGRHLAIMAGPCAVENEEQMMTAAAAVKEAGANILRGGAFKPRTTPYAFQGLGEEGLKLLRAAGDSQGMPVITEVLDPRDVDLVAEYADILQIGARNMQNFRLLEEVGKTHKPVMLKRGMCATIQELLLAAEYILSNGNQKVMLCERGIRTYETATRNTLDLSAVPVLQEMCHLPVIVDPSHATGNPNYIPALCRASIAAGANGIMVEVHPNPAVAKCDAQQALTPEIFSGIMESLHPIAKAVGKQI